MTRFASIKIRANSIAPLLNPHSFRGPAFAFQTPESLAERPGASSRGSAVPADELVRGELHDTAAVTLDIDAFARRQIS